MWCSLTESGLSRSPRAEDEIGERPRPLLLAEQVAVLNLKGQCQRFFCSRDHLAHGALVGVAAAQMTQEPHCSVSYVTVYSLGQLRIE